MYALRGFLSFREIFGIDELDVSGIKDIESKNVGIPKTRSAVALTEHRPGLRIA